MGDYYRARRCGADKFGGAIKCGLVMVITLRFCFMGIRAMGESF